MDEKMVIKNSMNQLTDDELRKIIYLNNFEYMQDAIDIAKRELFGRNSKNIWENEKTILKDLFECSSTEEVEKSILLFYPNKKEYLDFYHMIMDSLYSINVDEDIDIALSVEKSTNKTNGNDSSWKVFGKSISGSHAIDFKEYTWKKCLSFHIVKEDLQQFGKEAYVSHCIHKIFLASIAEDEISQKSKEIENQIPILNQEGLKESYNFFIADGIKRIKGERKELDKNNCPQVRPWIRYFARLLDFLLWASWMNYSWFLISPNTFRFVEVSLGGIFFGIMNYATWVFIEPLLLSKLGYTFGKWILKIKVRSRCNEKLTYSAALNRTIRVWVYGELLGLPYMYIITNGISYYRLKIKGKTKWDEECEVIVLHERIEKVKVFIAVSLIILLLIFLRSMVK